MRVQMSRTMTSFLIVVPAASALLLAQTTNSDVWGYVRTAGQADQQTAPQLLDLPTSWVAFEAKLRVFSPDMEKVEGRVFRASDGSQRVETGPVGGPIKTIDIRNIPQQTHYLFTRFARQPEATWTSAPMDVPEYGGFRPVLRRADQLGLRKHPFRVSVRPGDKPNVFATEGFEVFEYHDVGGNTHLQAPVLNMFDLVNQSITGRREEVYDVILREPMAEMFMPPPGVNVTRVATKRGIVLEPRGGHEARHQESPARPAMKGHEVR